VFSSYLELWMTDEAHKRNDSDSIIFSPYGLNLEIRILDKTLHEVDGSDIP
jgi:hypothetical protein